MKSVLDTTDGGADMKTRLEWDFWLSLFSVALSAFSIWFAVHS